MREATQGSDLPLRPSGGSGTLHAVVLATFGLRFIGFNFGASVQVASQQARYENGFGVS